MDSHNQIQGRPVNVDLIRTTAMFGVLLLHAAGRYPTTPNELQQMAPMAFVGWGIVDIYQSIAVPLGVPLFLMLTGALLLQPEKTNEPLGVFFKKRWARLGLPTLFWCVAYFAWDFLVQGIPFTSSAIIQGLLNGPYTQLWYLYVLAGLYLLTPILRVFMANANPTLIKYFVVLWVISVAVLPFFGLFSPYMLNDNVFTLTGYVGFFVLGTCLLTVNLPRKTLLTIAALGVALTAVGTYALAATVGGTEMYFFQQYFSPTILLTSTMVFLLLLTAKPPSTQKDAHTSIISRLIQLISENTLGIFFIHVMIIESIQKGYLGFTLNRTILNPIVEVPLLTIIVMFISLGIILLLKKIPHLKRLID